MAGSQSRPTRAGKEPIGLIALAIAGVVAYFGWAFLAADYFQSTPSEGSSEANFWVNSIEQLANLPSVIGYAFQERLWLVGLVALLEVGVVVLWRVLKKLENDW